MRRAASLLPLVLVGGAGRLVFAHGSHESHGQKPIVDEDATWMEKHMAGMSVSL